MVLDAGIYESGADNNYALVFDINGATMDHSNSLSYMGLKKFYQYLCKGTPIRWIGAHYVDTGIKNNQFQEFVKSNIVNADFVDRRMVGTFCKSCIERLAYPEFSKAFSSYLDSISSGHRYSAGCNGYGAVDAAKGVRR